MAGLWVFLFKTLTLLEGAGKRLQCPFLSSLVPSFSASPQRKVPFCPFVPMALGRRVRSLESQSFGYQDPLDLHLPSQFLRNNWNWCWSGGLRPVAICCKKFKKIPDKQNAGPRTRQCLPVCAWGEAVSTRVGRRPPWSLGWAEFSGEGISPCLPLTSLCCPSAYPP